MGPMTATHRLRYEGDPAPASAFAQMLQDEGLTVDWEPPYEERGGIVEDVLISLLASGTYDTIKTGVQSAIEKFHARFPGRARITDEDQAEDSGEG